MENDKVTDKKIDKELEKMFKAPEMEPMEFLQNFQWNN